MTLSSSANEIYTYASLYSHHDSQASLTIFPNEAMYYIVLLQLDNKICLNYDQTLGQHWDKCQDVCMSGFSDVGFRA